MSNIDIILVCVLLAGLVSGYYAGIVRIVTMLAAILAGIFLCFEFSGPLISLLRFRAGMSLSASYYTAYLLFILAGILLGALLARYLTKVVRFVFLHWLNKLAGAIGGLAIVVTLECIALNLLMILPPDRPVIDEKQARESILALPVAGIFKGQVEMPEKIDKEKITLPQ